MEGEGEIWNLGVLMISKFPIFFFNDLRTVPQYLIASFLKCIAKT